MDTNGFKLPKKVKDKWVKALRSRKYKQGEGMLYDKFEDSFCCLGVAKKEGLCKKNRDEEFVSTEFLSDRNDGSLFLINSGESNAFTKSFDTLKLRKWSFKKIANWIEKNL